VWLVVPQPLAQTDVSEAVFLKLMMITIVSLLLCCMGISSTVNRCLVGPDTASQSSQVRKERRRCVVSGNKSGSRGAVRRPVLFVALPDHPKNSGGQVKLVWIGQRGASEAKPGVWL